MKQGGWIKSILYSVRDFLGCNLNVHSMNLTDSGWQRKFNFNPLLNITGVIKYYNRNFLHTPNRWAINSGIRKRHQKCINLLISTLTGTSLRWIYIYWITYPGSIHKCIIIAHKLTDSRSPSFMSKIKSKRDDRDHHLVELIRRLHVFCSSGDPRRWPT